MRQSCGIQYRHCRTPAEYGRIRNRDSAWRHVDLHRPASGQQSAVEEINVWLIDHAQLLHCLPQIRGIHKCLRAVEVLCLKERDNLVRIVSPPKKMLLGETRLNALRQMRIVSALPLRKIPNLVPYEQEISHGNTPLN